VLAGSAEFIKACKPWRNRFGGDLAVGFPFIVSALDGLAERLPKMAAYHRHACAIASALEAAGLAVNPAVPHGNAFIVHFPVGADALTSAAHAVAADTGAWLFGRIYEGALPGTCTAEISVGDATLGWSADEVAGTLAGLVKGAGHSQAVSLHEVAVP
jgi:hypothetical protein